MRLLLWTVSLMCLALWSLLAWAASGLVGAAETLVPGLEGDPLGLGLVAANWADWLGLAGQGAIALVWAAGAAALLLGTAMLSRAFRMVGRLAHGRTGRGGRLPPMRYHRSSGRPAERLLYRLSPRLLRAVRR